MESHPSGIILFPMHPSPFTNSHIRQYIDSNPGIHLRKRFPVSTKKKHNLDPNFSSLLFSTYIFPFRKYKEKPRLAFWRIQRITFRKRRKYVEYIQYSIDWSLQSVRRRYSDFQHWILFPQFSKYFYRSLPKRFFILRLMWTLEDQNKPWSDWRRRVYRY